MGLAGQWADEKRRVERDRAARGDSPMYRDPRPPVSSGLLHTTVMWTVVIGVIVLSLIVNAS
jgi:hypothetical protein